MPLIFPGKFDFQVKSITNYLTFFNVLLRAYSESEARVSSPPAAAGREGERSGAVRRRRTAPDLSPSLRRIIRNEKV